CPKICISVVSWRQSMLPNRKDDAVVLVLDSWPQSGKVVVPRLNNPFGRTRIAGRRLEEKGRGLQVHTVSAEWRISLPKNPPAGTKPIVFLETVGEPYFAKEPTVTSEVSGVLKLVAHHAETRGEKLLYEPQPHKNTVGYWVDPKAYCFWHVNIDEPGRFRVEILQGCGKGQGGSVAKIACGDSSLEFTVEETGHFQNFTWRDLGTIELAKGAKQELAIRVVKLAKNALMDVRTLRLTRISARR
ncbi:MAG: hypothetical protein AAF517_26255, partial [Planctomycetota bacterium]